MINHQRKPGDGSGEGPVSPEERQRILELELAKIKNEAAAAQLEARAVEIELLLNRLRHDSVRPEAERGTTFSSDASEDVSRNPETVKRRFRSWDEVRVLYRSAAPNAVPTDRSESPHNASRVGAQTGSERPTTANESGTRRRAANTINAAPDHVLLPGRTSADPSVGLAEEPTSLPVAQADSKVEITSADRSEDQRGRRPRAWVASGIAHGLLLIVLAVIGVQTQRPKDQVSLSASVAEVSPVAVETFTIEPTSEPETEVPEPTPAEAEHELSPVGELVASEYLSVAPSPPTSGTSAFAGSMPTSQSLQSDSNATMQFCGVEGGGNHFVYLVDSSKSMGEGFESARRELLRSIAVLKPDQRFYVVFFDADPDYMRLKNPEQDEQQSVLATPANKSALRRWAMGVGMDRGRAPYEALQFALQLRPDVIFLLSDGEFPQGIEDLLRDQNRVDNLFGDHHPISIVHTIGYFSKEGESRMRRIAEQNDGQYRHIPQP